MGFGALCLGVLAALLAGIRAEGAALALRFSRLESAVLRASGGVSAGARLRASSAAQPALAAQPVVDAAAEPAPPRSAPPHIPAVTSNSPADAPSAAPAPFSSTNPNISSPQLYHNDGRTLLIIQGAWRSLARTVGSIVEHLVLPNAPCDVILSLDKPGPDATLPVFSELQPYLAAVMYPQTPDHPEGIEFAQITRGFQVVDVSKYAFIGKSRTDLMIFQDFTFKAGVGIGKNFPDLFSRFLAGARVRFPDTNPCGILEAWVRSSGMLHYAAFAHPIDKNASLRNMAWAPISSYEMSPAIEIEVKAACLSAWGGDGSGESQARGWRFLETEPNALRAAVQRIASRSRLFYGQGSTWMSWGERDEFIALHSEMLASHQLLDWANLPPPGNEWRFRNKFCDGDCPRLNRATESTFRMAHVMQGLSFAELYDYTDFEVSFDRFNRIHCIDGDNENEIVHGFLQAGKSIPGAFIMRMKHPICVPHQQLLNPFCGSSDESGHMLVCEYGVIDAVSMAFYGTPTGTCPAFSAGICNEGEFLAYAQRQCIGFKYCALTPINGRPDPCPGMIATLPVRFSRIFYHISSYASSHYRNYEANCCCGSLQPASWGLGSTWTTIIMLWK